MGSVSVAPDPSTAAAQARERLHEEIERVRVGVEEMLDERYGDDAALRRELDELRKETRRYVKKRVRKSEKRTEKRLREVDQRTGELERRFEAFEQDRRYAEWRIHTNTEAMLDGLLGEVRAIADLLTASR
jgi:hypothetical protein